MPLHIFKKYILDTLYSSGLILMEQKRNTAAAFKLVAAMGSQLPTLQEPVDVLIEAALVMVKKRDLQREQIH